MSWLSDIFAGGASGIFSGIADIVGRFKADPTVVAQHAEKLAELDIALKQAQMQVDVQLSMAQNKVNEIEAASTKWWVNGWRPSVGWVCSFGLFVALIVGPFFTWASGWITSGHPGPFPALDTNVLLTMLGGMLGIGGLRTYEKVAGVSK